MTKSLELWLNRIEKAEKHYKEYHEMIKKIRDYYKNDKKNNETNIFWSSIETLKPFLYFKQPKPYVDQKDKSFDAVAALAAKILEKALIWDLEQFDFDSIIKYVRNDFLLAGCGLAFERYKPTFKTVESVDVDGEMVEVVDSETVETIYIDPADFIADSEKVGIWEDCTWWARRIYMTRQEVVAQFGDDVEPYLLGDEEEDRKKSVTVYEIWDKESRKVLYLTKDCKTRFLKETEDIFGVSGFWPMPKPIFATTTSDSIVPVPDYTEIRVLLKELSGVTERMRLTMRALKVSGAYDNSFPELVNILNKDVTLVALNDFERLKQAGGIKGVMDFAPIEQYVNALSVLAERRKDLVSQIYEITGVSDIMRGNSDPNETATAVAKKTNFGTLRNQDRQNDMQRFITDLLKIKAEIMCERFSLETFVQFAGKEDDPRIVMAAVELLKTDKIRGLTLGIETDTSFNAESNAQKTIEAVTLINNMVNQSFDAISAQPLLLPLYKKMVESVVISLPNARQFETVIDDVFNKIGSQLSQPQQKEPSPEMMKVEIDKQKAQGDLQIKQEQNEIKREELALKKQIEDNKVAMTNKEAEMQFALKQQEIDSGIATSANITTGHVRGF